MEDADGSDCGLVVVDLGVCDAGVVVDDGMHERIPELRTAVSIACLAGGGGTIVLALLATDVTPAAAVGDVSDLLHIDMYQRPRVRVLIAANRLPGCAVDIGESVQSRATQDAVNGGRRDPQPRGQLNRSFPQANA